MKNIIRYISLYISDQTIRLNVSIFIGLILNICYIIFNLISGILYKNLWFVTVAAYYSIIVSLRYIVIGDYREKETDSAIQNSRTAGILMLILGVPMTGIIIYTVVRGVEGSYLGALLVFFALHSLFSVIRSVYWIVKDRNKKSVSVHTAHSVRLSGALMSLFNFQTSLFSGILISDTVKIFFNFATGAIASMAVFVLATKIVFDANTALAIRGREK